MPTNSKRKGKEGELEVVKLLRDHGFNARRGQQFKGSPDSPDIILEECPVDHHVEVKRTESLSLYKAMEQASKDASKTQVPIIFHRRSKQAWLVIMQASEYLDILQRLKKAEAQEVLGDLY